MPTTTYTDSTFAASVLGARTDNAGVAVVDTTAEEARLLATLLNQGYLTPTNAFVVAAQASPNMTIKVGSGGAKTDYYVVAGTVVGQGNYVIRHDVASVNVTITAADASQTRTDELYLVVQDNTYDTSARVLPRIGYRKGDVGGANPGADASWKASVLLARVTVPAAATTITSGNISDQRTASTLLSNLVNTAAFVTKASYTGKGDLLVGSAASTPTVKGVGVTGHTLMADPAQTTGVKWAPTVAANQSEVLTTELTTSGSFTNLATSGPAVTLTVGPLGIAIVTIAAQFFVDSYSTSYMSFAATGANSWGAFYTDAIEVDGQPEYIHYNTYTKSTILTLLNPGSTTFTAKYACAYGGGSAAGFMYRRIGVVTF